MEKTKRKAGQQFIVSFITITLFFLGSCTEKNIVDEQNLALKKGSWGRNDTLKFSFEIEDTISTYLASCFVKNEGDYPFSNLFMNYSLIDSNSKTIEGGIRDLLIYDPKSGEPLGKKEMIGNQVQGVYALDTLEFKNKGKYTIALNHSMRDLESTEKITNIGIQILKINP